MAVTWKTLAYKDDVLLKADFTTKGGLLAATGTGTFSELAVGTDGYALVADSNESTGLKYVLIGSGDGDFMADGSVPMTGDLDFGGNEAKQMVLEVVADDTAQAALTPVVGMMIWRTDLGAPNVCTVAA
jgi:hypothetical protein